jgi:hypothetical protein
MYPKWDVWFENIPSGNSDRHKGPKNNGHGRHKKEREEFLTHLRVFFVTLKIEREKARTVFHERGSAHRNLKV